MSLLSKMNTKTIQEPNVLYGFGGALVKQLIEISSIHNGIGIYNLGFFYNSVNKNSNIINTYKYAGLDTSPEHQKEYKKAVDLLSKRYYSMVYRAFPLEMYVSGMLGSGYSDLTNVTFMSGMSRMGSLDFLYYFSESYKVYAEYLALFLEINKSGNSKDDPINSHMITSISIIKDLVRRIDDILQNKEEFLEKINIFLESKLNQISRKNLTNVSIISLIIQEVFILYPTRHLIPSLGFFGHITETESVASIGRYDSLFTSSEEIIKRAKARCNFSM